MENLHGARCVGHAELFDVGQNARDLGYASESERWDMCQLICRACPARGACWAWAKAVSTRARPGADGRLSDQPVQLSAAWPPCRGPLSAQDAPTPSADMAKPHCSSSHTVTMAEEGYTHLRPTGPHAFAWMA